MKTWKVGLLFTTISIPLYAAFLYLTLILFFMLRATPAYPSDEDVLKPRVPSDKIAEAKALKNTVAADVKILSEAREIFTGKGTCYTCHGEKGKGDGEIAESMNPPPRDFTYTPWQEVRTDGELFWVINNGTENGMPPFADILTDEERWSLVNYIREFGKSSSIASKQ
ncbi:MAG: hypothetical protein A3I04_01005 [Nitrospinae bacterium RIFCSPLOWO2_02_FULL_39_110]|nr:MAG: hypothetical protein A2W53_00195 [Nitrospinae bacterium RIFCSPHIGHO2_02_39_11]OGW00774.1 MAG: hypothetical protein A3D97_02220 [Nitrospinae bacterium RIFCSPHIGHO2_12_FULL_39_42]OGW01857.1 MAG: hypothetical protein A3D20_00170 [Nitrospinae bacterium RIFCSPHIGHO2_02_FULL_39_82]OGW03952.1 MAG: hypothetical protein A2Z59_01895 [Nitrospinae bacterium RIFCSPLOWO2_02_39_17]OGW06161.1 MAG: hypothetical protein A3I04_01005 [Nitrospinae bacterium RIFCSPLOWO2_02_FULL_39_110]OGW11442.1 MAG: hypoth